MTSQISLGPLRGMLCWHNASTAHLFHSNSFKSIFVVLVYLPYKKRIIIKQITNGFEKGMEYIYYDYSADKYCGDTKLKFTLITNCGNMISYYVHGVTIYVTSFHIAIYMRGTSLSISSIINTSKVPLFHSLSVTLNTHFNNILNTSLKY